MKLALVKGSTNVTINVFIQDSSATDGSGLTGLVYNSSGLKCYYTRPGSNEAQLSLATQTTTGAHSDGGFVEIGSTNSPGLYRLDLSDAILASGVDSVTIMLHGATDMAPCPIEIQLTDFDLNDSGGGGDGSSFDSIPWNSAWDAEVQSEVADAIVAYGLDHLVFTSVSNTDVADNSIVAQLVSKSTTADYDDYDNESMSLQAIAEMDGSTYTAVPWNSSWDAEVQSECNDALVAIHLDHLFAVDYDPASKPGTSTALLNELIESDGGVSRFTANSLEEGPGGGGDGSSLTSIPWNSAWDAEVQSEVEDAIVAYGLDHLFFADVSDGDITDGALASAIVVHVGTSDTTGTSNTIDLESGEASTTDDIYNGMKILLVAGTGAGQERIISDYDGTTNQRATVSENWSTTPDGTTQYMIVPHKSDGSTLDSIPWNPDWDTEVESEVNDALVALGLDHLISTSVTGSDVADDSIIAYMVSRSATADWDSYDNTTDSLEALYAEFDDIKGVGWSSTHTLYTLYTQNQAIGIHLTDMKGAGWSSTDTLENIYDLVNGTGSGFSAIPWNSAWDAEVQSEVQDAIEENHLDHLLAVDYDPASKPGVSTALLNELVEDDGGVSRFTSNALEEGPSGGGGGASVTDIWTYSTRTLTAITDTVGDEIADRVLLRSPSNVEGSATKYSLCSVVLKHAKSELITGPLLRIYQTDGTSTFVDLNVQTDPNSLPVIGIG